MEANNLSEVLSVEIVNDVDNRTRREGLTLAETARLYRELATALTDRALEIEEEVGTIERAEDAEGAARDS